MVQSPISVISPRAEGVLSPGPAPPTSWPPILTSFFAPFGQTHPKHPVTFTDSNNVTSQGNRDVLEGIVVQGFTFLWGHGQGFIDGISSVLQKLGPVESWEKGEKNKSFAISEGYVILFFPKKLGSTQWCDLKNVCSYHSGYLMLRLIPATSLQNSSLRLLATRRSAILTAVLNTDCTLHLVHFGNYVL